VRVYNEHTGVEFTAWFTSNPGVPTLPLSVHYRLRCLTNDLVLQDWTELAPEIIADETGITGVKVVIDVDGALNVLQDSNNRRETKQLQVVAAKDTPREFSKFRDYAVANGGGR